MTAETFCDVLLKLDIGSVLFSGDSLTRSMRHSLINKMGKEKRFKRLAPRMIILFVDSSSSEEVVKSIPIFHHDATGGSPFPNTPRQNTSFDNVTRDLIQSSPNRVLGIYNIGAHYHAKDWYTDDFDQFIVGMAGAVPSSP
jgi:hypothetical protein